jgi:hypothetical protein
MNKAAVICKLHEIADYYLLEEGVWPINQEFLQTFFKTVRELGLDEDVPEMPGTTRSTAIGKELNLDLLMVFVGAWDFWDIPHILEENGYVEESEADELYNGPPLGAERKLRCYVLRSYLKFCNRSSLLN